jgi:surface antigen
MYVCALSAMHEPPLVRQHLRHSAPFSTIALLICVSVLLLLQAGAIAQDPNAHTSPNGFARPQCTWWADMETSAHSWDLNFSVSSGRDAYKWWDQVTNAGSKSATPVVGSVMVLDQSSSLPVGHVGYVTAVNGNAFTISHANWPSGSGPHDASCTISGSSVSIEGGANHACRGFLCPTQNTRTITTVAGPSGAGTITPTNPTFTPPSNLTLTAHPNTGYQLGDWYYNDTIQPDYAGSATFPCVGFGKDCTVKHVFKPISLDRTITTVTEPFGAGTVTPTNPTFTPPSNLTLTAHPKTGYQLGDWYYNDTIQPDYSGSATFPCVGFGKDCTVKHVFKPISLDRTITTPVEPPGAGTVTPANPTFTPPSNLTLTAHPNAGYQLGDWYYNDTIQPDYAGSATFPCVGFGKDCTVKHVFKVMPVPAGDLNNDGKVDEIDADLVLQYLAGGRNDLDAAVKALATAKGLANPPDVSAALWILQHIARTSGGEPVDSPVAGRPTGAQ